MKELAPYNKELNTISTLLHFIKTAQANNVRFEETKTHLKQKHPETYNTLGLSSKNSFNELTNTIQAHIAQLEDSKKKVTKKINQKLKRVISQNKKEAERKDRATEEMLRFFNEIGLDIINQSTFTQIVDMVNLNPLNYGLQQPIDIENSSLGFDYDFGNNTMSLPEKKAFIGFINKML